MEKLIHASKTLNYFKFVIYIVLFCMVSFSTNTYAASDTTTFRIKIIQDSVYAGDAIDVEFYIGNGSAIRSILNLNLLKQMEIEVAANRNIIQPAQTTFSFDYASLSSFFNTTLSNINAVSNLDPVLGNLNIKVNSNKIGKGNARIGNSKYIVQDNVAGRQFLSIEFTKAISSGLLGLVTSPVKLEIDSVLVIGRRTEIEAGQQYYPQPQQQNPHPQPQPTQQPTQPTNTPKPTEPTRPKETNSDRIKDETLVKPIKIYPNPATDNIQIEAQNVLEYKLIDLSGAVIISNYSPTDGLFNININELQSGVYLLMIKTNENWIGNKIIKQ